MNDPYQNLQKMTAMAYKITGFQVLNSKNRKFKAKATRKKKSVMT